MSKPINQVDRGLAKPKTVRLPAMARLMRETVFAKGEADTDHANTNEKSAAA
jgi:hypothetical protein